MEFVQHQGAQDIDDALDIRRQVFIEEQGVPEDLEIDGLDDQAKHYIAYNEGRPAATARVRLIDDATTAKIERVAVAQQGRGTGLGAQLMRHIEANLVQNGIHQAVLESQTHARGFYQKLGYTAVGDEFEEAGIPHIKMQKSLS